MWPHCKHEAMDARNPGDVSDKSNVTTAGEYVALCVCPALSYRFHFSGDFTVVALGVCCQQNTFFIRATV